MKRPISQGTSPSNEQVFGECLDFLKQLEFLQQTSTFRLPDYCYENYRDLLTKLTEICEDV